MAGTVTITHARKRFRLTYSQLPGKVFGSFEFPDVIQELRISALLSPIAARTAVFDAVVNGCTTVTIGTE